MRRTKRFLSLSCIDAWSSSCGGRDDRPFYESKIVKQWQEEQKGGEKKPGINGGRNFSPKVLPRICTQVGHRRWRAIPPLVVPSATTTTIIICLVCIFATPRTVIRYCSPLFDRIVPWPCFARTRTECYCSLKIRGLHGWVSQPALRDLSTNDHGLTRQLTGKLVTQKH